jgi:hypothetical protein
LSLSLLFGVVLALFLWFFGILSSSFTGYRDNLPARGAPVHPVSVLHYAHRACALCEISISMVSGACLHWLFGGMKSYFVFDWLIWLWSPNW